MLNSNYELDLNTSFKCGVFWNFFSTFLLLSPLMVALLALLSSGGVSHALCAGKCPWGQRGVQPSPWGHWGVQPSPWGQQGVQPSPWGPWGVQPSPGLSRVSSWPVAVGLEWGWVWLLLSFRVWGVSRACTSSWLWRVSRQELCMWRT